MYLDEEGSFDVPELTFYSPLNLGSTRNAVAIMRLLNALKKINQWADTTFRKSVDEEIIRKLVAADGPSA